MLIGAKRLTVVALTFKMVTMQSVGGPNPKDLGAAAADSAAPAFCSSLRDYYQAGLEGRAATAPFRVVDQSESMDVPRDFVPAHGALEDDVSLTSMTSVVINGRPARIARVQGDGSCGRRHWELWSADLQEYFGEASGSLVVIDGKTYLLGPDTERIEVIGFHSDLNTYPVCAIALRPRKPEQISLSVDSRLCEAVQRGKVEDVGLSEITPAAVGRQSFGSTLKTEALSYEYFSRGSVDLTNNGRVEHVAMVRSYSGTMGCSDVSYVLEWPQVLNARGLPDVRAPANRFTQDIAGEKARLIRYRGRIYVDSRSSPNRRDSHNVFELHREGVKKMCSFTPVLYVVEEGDAPTAMNESSTAGYSMHAHESR